MQPTCFRSKTAKQVSVLSGEYHTSCQGGVITPLIMLRVHDLYPKSGVEKTM